MARMRLGCKAKTLLARTKIRRVKNSICRVTSGPKRILRYIFGSTGQRYSWTLFKVSSDEPFAFVPPSPNSMQIDLDLDGRGGISGNTKALTRSPAKGVGGLKIRNKRFVVTPSSTNGSLSFVPRAFLTMGGSRSFNDSPASRSDGHRTEFDLEANPWLLTYDFFDSINTPKRGGNPKPIGQTNARMHSVSNASSDGYRAEIDLAKDPWLRTYDFLNSMNDKESEPARLQPTRAVTKGRSLRRMRDKEDMRSKWGQDNDGDDAGTPSGSIISADNRVQNPSDNDRPTPAQHSGQQQPDTPSVQANNLLPSKCFPSPTTQPSRPGSGSRCPPHDLHINVPQMDDALAQPEPPTPLPTLQDIPAIPVTDGLGERGVVVDWNREPSQMNTPRPLTRAGQRPRTAPSAESQCQMERRRPQSDLAQPPLIQFQIDPLPPPPSPPRLPIPIPRTPTCLRSGTDSPLFNKHLNFTFTPPSIPRLHPSPISIPNTSTSTQPPSPPASSHSQRSHRSPSTTIPAALTILPFAFEGSTSPSLAEKIEQEFQVALKRVENENEWERRRRRRSREITACMGSSREVTTSEGRERLLG